MTFTILASTYKHNHMKKVDKLRIEKTSPYDAPTTLGMMVKLNDHQLNEEKYKRAVFALYHSNQGDPTIIKSLILLKYANLLTDDTLQIVQETARIWPMISRKVALFIVFLNKIGRFTPEIMATYMRDLKKELWTSKIMSSIFLLEHFDNANLLTENFDYIVNNANYLNHVSSSDIFKTIPSHLLGSIFIPSTWETIENIIAENIDQTVGMEIISSYLEALTMRAKHKQCLDELHSTVDIINTVQTSIVEFMPTTPQNNRNINNHFFISASLCIVGMIIAILDQDNVTATKNTGALFIFAGSALVVNSFFHTSTATTKEDEASFARGPHTSPCF